VYIDEEEEEDKPVSIREIEEDDDGEF